MIEILQYWGDKLRKEHEIDAIAITEWQLMYAQGDWWKIRAMELFHKLPLNITEVLSDSSQRKHKHQTMQNKHHFEVA